LARRLKNTIHEKLHAECLSDCYNFYFNKLSRSNFELNHLYSAITEHFCFSTVIVDKYERPGELFYELNYGGKILTDIDKLRVTFFADLDSSLYHIYYDNYWKSIEKNFYEKPSQFEDYISTIIGYIGLEQNNEPIKEFIHDLRSLDRNSRDKKVQDFLRKMGDLWGYYKYLTEPNQSEIKHCDEIKLRLTRLNILDISPALPLLLHWVEYCKIVNMPSPEEKKLFIEILKVVETYYVRNYVCRERATIILKFNELNKIILPNPNLDEYLKEIKAFLHQSLPPDISFQKELEVSRLYKVQGGALSRLILFALEYELNDKSGIFWNLSGYSVEHIMPQTLNEQWKNYLGNNCEDIQSEWCHTLGNLTLVPNNYDSSYSNKFYYEKRTSYQEYNYGLFNTIKEYNEWKANEIKNRGKELAKTCTENIWSNFFKIQNSNQDNQDTHNKSNIIFEPVMKGDRFKAMYINMEPISAINKSKYFFEMVRKIREKDPIAFEKIKHNKHLFSKESKHGFSTEFKEEEIFLKSSSDTPKIAENCSFLRELLEWSHDKWYGEVERVENGIKRSIYFK